MSSYYRVHQDLKKLRGRAAESPCSSCGTEEGRREWAYQYNAGPDELMEEGGQYRGCLYSVDIWNHYAPMCVPCHRSFDRENDPRILEVLRETGRKNGLSPRVWDARRERLETDPEYAREYSERYSRTMTTTNSRRYRCAECEYENNAGNLGHHKRKTGHSGRVPTEAA